MNRSVLRPIWRHSFRHPWQGLLATVGVTLGVAITVAVDLANSSATRAFELSARAVTGPATDQVIGGPGGLDERIYVRLRTRERGILSSPVVEGYGQASGLSLHILGIDPLAERDFRRHDVTSTSASLPSLLMTPNAAVLPDLTAQRLGLRAGDRFQLDVGGRVTTLTLVDTIATTPISAPGLDGLLLTDISTAQVLLDMVGRVSWIDLMIAENQAAAARRAQIDSLLPDSAMRIAARSRTQAMQEMTHAFRVNLTAMSLFAVLIGIFLIYNAVSFTVLQRHRLLATLRVLGVTRGEIFATVLAETSLIGLLGTAIGIGLGILVGTGLVQLVTRTIDDLYFTLSVRQLFVTPVVITKAALIGLGTTILAGLGPAADAGSTTPQLALHRSRLESRARVLVPRLAGIGAIVTIGAVTLLLTSDRGLIQGFLALFLFVSGLTLLGPATLGLLTSVLAPAKSSGLKGVEARLAIRLVSGSLSRAGLATAALMLAVSATVGVGIMVESFRHSVHDWLASTFKADIYVAAPSVQSFRTTSRLSEELLAELGGIDGVSSLSTARSVYVESDRDQTEILALHMPKQLRPRYRLQAGDPEQVWPSFEKDLGVLVSEPYAYKYNLAVGDLLALRTDHGPSKLAVLGIYRDYESGSGTVLMNRSLYDSLYQDRGINGIGVYLKKGADHGQAIDAIRAAASATGRSVIIKSNAELRQSSMQIFDRTFTITAVLRLLAMIVAFFATLSALTALALEHAREIAVLRTTGLTKTQCTELIFFQSLFMGSAAGILAIPVGTVLGLILTEVINRRAFGWSLDIVISFEPLITAIGLAIGAAFLASLYPAWKVGRSAPALMLREE